VPKKAKPAKRRAFYKSPPPKPPEGVTGLRSEASTRQARDQPSLRSFGTAGKWRVTRKTKAVGRESVDPKSSAPSTLNAQLSTVVLPHAHSISPAHFSLREDGSIGAPNSDSARSTSSLQHADSEIGAPPSTPSLIYASDSIHPSLLRQLSRIIGRHRRQISRWPVRRHLCRPACVAVATSSRRRPALFPACRAIASERRPVQRRHHPAERDKITVWTLEPLGKRRKEFDRR
jgi:hypothetical protein